MPVSSSVGQRDRRASSHELVHRGDRARAASLPVAFEDDGAALSRFELGAHAIEERGAPLRRVANGVLDVRHVGRCEQVEIVRVARGELLERRGVLTEEVVAPEERRQRGRCR